MARFPWGCALVIAGTLGAQDPEGLGALLDLKVTVAARLPQTPERAPSAVVVITREDIERYGWRELADILRALPGFDFGNDSSKLIGLAERGIWAHEGKALLLVNGHTVSPLHNGNVNYYGFLPSDMIERVEVIRGPGSAVYGQFAGATVISIQARKADGPEGGRFTVRGTTLGAGDHGGGAYLSASGTLSSGVSMALSAGYQVSPFSITPYVDSLLTGKTFPQEKGNTRMTTAYVSGEVLALGTRVSFLRTTYDSSQVDWGGSGPSDPPVAGLWPGTTGNVARVQQGARVSRTFELPQDFRLEALVEGLENTPGAVFPGSGVAGGIFHSGSERRRSTGELGLRWQPRADVELQAGAGGIQEWERGVDLQGRGALRDKADPALRRPVATLVTTYGFFQYSQQWQHLGLTLGARNQNSDLGSAFAPRMGLTWQQGAFNGKLLYGEAFRAPTLFQAYSVLYAFRGGLRPELIRSSEVELGWRMAPGVVGRLNLYRMRVSRAISSGLDNNAYYIQNAGGSGSRGVEASLDIKRVSYGAFANLSWVRPDSDSDPYFLNQDHTRFLGLMPLKVNVGGFVALGPVTLAPSLLFAGARDVQTPRSAQSGNPSSSLLPNIVESSTVPARVLLNLALSWQGLLGRDSEARFSLQNATGIDLPLLQPYYGGHAPLPAHDRRMTLDLTWRF